MDLTQGEWHAWKLRRPTAKTQMWINSLQTVHDSDPGRVAPPTARRENSHTRMHLLEGILRVVLLDDVHVGDLITTTEYAVGTRGQAAGDAPVDHSSAAHSPNHARVRGPPELPV